LEWITFQLKTMPKLEAMLKCLGTWFIDIVNMVYNFTVPCQDLTSHTVSLPLLVVIWVPGSVMPLTSIDTRSRL
jgi:hypothetical protein